MLGVCGLPVCARFRPFYPLSTIFTGDRPQLSVYEALYFGRRLTSTGFGDIARFPPGAGGLHRRAGERGTFVAILIARLAGVYPPRLRENA